MTDTTITASELLAESEEFASTLNESRNKFNKTTIFSMVSITRIMDALNRNNAFEQESLEKVESRFNIGIPEHRFIKDSYDFALSRGKNNSHQVTVFGKLVGIDDIEDKSRWMDFSLQLTYGEHGRNLIGAAYV